MNDLFFLCSLIEYIGRKTKNRRSVVTEAMGERGLRHVYDYADVYHCENIDKVSDELIEKYQIPVGDYDNVAMARYSVPTHWDIGKVYHRLIADVSAAMDEDVITALMAVYASWIAERIDNYNSSMYYESPGFLFASYQTGHVLV